MFKSSRWRSEKNKIKAVFKFHFQVFQVPKSGWETLMVVLVPTDLGRPTVRSEKTGTTDGSCRIINPVFETTKLTRDAKTGKVHDKLYQFIVSSSGSSKGGILGEASINLGEYLEAFKPSNVTLALKGNSGAFLHVTIQRLVGDDDGREGNENGEITAKPRRKTLQSQLSCEDEESDRGKNGIISKEDGSVLNNKQTPIKFASSRNLSLISESNDLKKSHSFDAISASDSDNNSSGRFSLTPRERENSMMNSTSYVSPLSQIVTPQKGQTSSDDWSTSNSGEASEENVEKLRSEVVSLTRKADMSELELQTLRKQVVKESRRAQDLFREINVLKEERDRFKRECEGLRIEKVSGGGDEGYNGNLLEEMKNELGLERSTNSNLRLQLEKLQESNSELLEEIKDLEEIVEGREREISSLKTDTSRNFETNGVVDPNGGPQSKYEMERRVIELSSELELYKKDREEMEMQMEQLALDYEILKQENHDVSSKLEQVQLREQLRMQYECSAHLAVISDLETHVENLEKEIREQYEDFEREFARLMDEKVEQEKRAIKAEEELREVRWSNGEMGERLQDEFKSLYTQVTSIFDSNEKLVCELRVQKREVEEKLERSREELESVSKGYQGKIQQLLSLVDFKSKEIDELAGELKSKTQECENSKKMDEAKLKDLREEMVGVRNEMERIGREKMETLLSEMERLKALNYEKESIIKDRVMQVEKLEREMEELKEEMMSENETSVGILKNEIESLRAQCCVLENSLSELQLEKEKLENMELTCSRVSQDKNSKENGDCNKLDDILREMEVLKEKNELMEEELKEMQERYSEISLKFAEVEGERQQLVMTIRSLRNALRN
ncbi:hypothetical protein LUZ60_014775 [Juncus effusus]|nr:hypothetical protein LUZ60_014775 [Juncus effusus]